MSISLPFYVSRKAAIQGGFKAYRDEVMRGFVPKPDEVKPFDFEGAVLKLQKAWRPPTWDGTNVPTEKLKTCEALGVTIPAYSPEKAEKLKVTADPPFIRRSTKENKIPGHVVEGIDLRSAFPQQPTRLSQGNVIPDPAYVRCSWCGMWLHRDQATFGKGVLDKTRVEEIIEINGVKVIDEKVVHFSRKQVACPDHCLMIKDTVFPETRG